MALPDSAQRYELPEEADIQAGPLKVNYTLWWKVGLFIIGLLSVFVAGSVQVLWAGLVLDVLLVVFYVAFIAIKPFDTFRTNLLSKVYRGGENKAAEALGLNKYLAPEIRRGEALGADNRKAPQPKSFGRIGKIRFRAHIADPSQPDNPIGYAYDRRYKTLSAGLRVSAAPALMSNTGVDGTQIDGLQRLLDDLVAGGSQIHGLVWRDQTILGETQNPDALVHTLQTGAGLSAQSALPHVELIKRRLAGMGDAAVVHSNTMMVSVKATKSVLRRVKPRDLLVQELSTLYSIAMGQGEATSPLGWRAASALTYSQLLWENRMALDPVYAKPYWEQEKSRVSSDVLLEHTAWPNTADFSPVAYCRMGQTYHAGFYIPGFPRNGVTLEQLWALYKVEVPKTISVFIKMVPPDQAQLRAQLTTNGVRGRNAERQEARKRVTEVQQISAEQAIRDERAIAERNHVGRMRAYIDVTGSSVAELMQHVKMVMAARSPSGCRLEPLDGRQDIGIEAVLPICRGLASFTMPDWLRM